MSPLWIMVFSWGLIFAAFSPHSRDSSETRQSPVSIQPKALTNIKLESLDGTIAYLDDFLGRGPVYVNFWALWCEPCKQELRAMKSVVKELPENSFTLLAINLDSPKSLAKVKAYVRSQEYPFPVALDPNEQVFHSFNGQQLPFAVLLNRNGAVVATRTGYLPGDETEIKAEILQLIQQ